MEGQNKHFSHPHNLNNHHLPDGTEITCSGCNSSGTTTVYACWQCNFFLHEQCFQASRSLQHPSHPSHPLTLLPFPTYPSNSFYCNSCNQIGTGFTYCCSDCEFDLHVQCAYSISLSSLLTPQAHIHHQQIQTPSFSPPLSNQAPIFNPQNVFLPHQVPAHQHILNPSPNQQTFSSYNPQYASIPHQPIPSAPILNYPIIEETGLSFSAAHPSHNHVQNYPPIHETVQNFNNPQNSHIPSQNSPIKETVQNFNHVPNYPQPPHNPQPVSNNPRPSYPSINEPLPSLNAPQIPQVVPITTSPPKAETYASSNATTGVSYTQSTPKPDQVNQVKAREITHFSHPHALLLVNPKTGEDSTKCSACEEIISGSSYSCSKSDCNFHLDDSCFRLSQAILHKSHPDHPLTLLSYASDQYGQFICRACYKDAYGFTYHCTTCEYDLHIKCASLPETVKRDDHVHPLKLVYSSPNKGKENTFYCDECGGIVQENWWTYYCEECDYGTHVDCDYHHEESQENAVKESQNEKSDEPSAVNHDLDFQVEMQRLQLELEMARQMSQMMASMGQSISNLAG